MVEPNAHDVPRRTVEVDLNVPLEKLDAAIEKANRLVELLREAETIIDSLSGERSA